MWKSVKIWQNSGHEFVSSFFGHPVFLIYLFLTIPVRPIPIFAKFSASVELWLDDKSEISFSISQLGDVVMATKSMGMMGVAGCSRAGLTLGYAVHL